MNVQKWLILHSVVLILSGLGFLLYSPLVMAWLGLSAVVQDSEGYWAMVSFARLFGMALMAWGATLLFVSQVLMTADSQGRILKRLLWMLSIADFLAAFSAAIQAASVWGIPASWLISIGFGGLGIVSLVWLLLARKPSMQ
ncbi:MAG: hypothetical protein DDG59_02515 [Anaerolineae bacterium]|nr:MAG: hypothetical protein DDG59_02515 [Anaerolineae bacterium]